MSDKAHFSGIIPILITPFDADGRIDHDSLESLIDFNISAGVHALGVAIGSEFFKFSEAERDELISRVVRHTDKRVPVIINTSASGTSLCVELSQGAQRLGADAVMVYPPFMMNTGPSASVAHYRAVASAIEIPVILQDIPQAPVSAAMALELAKESESIRTIKVETLPTVPQVGTMVKKAGDTLTVIGGAGGSYMIEEYRRGARGVMPFCSQPGAFVAVWNLLEAGREREARQLFDTTIMAVNRLAAQEGDLFYHVHKQLLVRLGVIQSADVRAPTIALDSVTQGEIEAVVESAVAATKLQ